MKLCSHITTQKISIEKLKLQVETYQLTIICLFKYHHILTANDYLAHLGQLVIVVTSPPLNTPCLFITHVILTMVNSKAKRNSIYKIGKKMTRSGGAEERLPILETML